MTFSPAEIPSPIWHGWRPTLAPLVVTLSLGVGHTVEARLELDGKVRVRSTPGAPVGVLVKAQTELIQQLADIAARPLFFKGARFSPKGSLTNARN